MTFLGYESDNALYSIPGKKLDINIKVYYHFAHIPVTWDIDHVMRSKLHVLNKLFHAAVRLFSNWSRWRETVVRIKTWHTLQYPSVSTETRQHGSHLIYTCITKKTVNDICASVLQLIINTIQWKYKNNFAYINRKWQHHETKIMAIHFLIINVDLLYDE